MSGGTPNAKPGAKNDWRPGMRSPNPKGRPKSNPEFVEQIRRMIAPDAFNKLKAAVAKKEPWAIRIALAYAWGQPPQRQELTGLEGEAIVFEEKIISPRSLSDEQIDQLERILERVDVANPGATPDGEGPPPTD